MNNRLEQFVRDHREEFDAEEPDSKVWDAIGRDMGLVDTTKKKQATVVRIYRARWTAAAAIVLLIAGATWYLNAHRNISNNLPAVASGNAASPATAQSATQPGTQPAAGSDTPARTLASSQNPDSNHSLAATSPNPATNPKGANSGNANPGGASPDVANNAKSGDNSNAELDASVNEEMYHYAKIVEIKHKELKAIQKDEPLLYKQFSADVYTLDSVYHNLQSQLPKNPNREQILEAMLQNLQLQMGLLNHQLDIIKQINHSKKTAYDKAYKTA
jgi:hypothetical protein